MHHLLPFHGVAHVGYLPGERIIGLSKLGRVVEYFSRDLQIQERLTTQVADWLERELEPKGGGVVLERHASVLAVPCALPLPRESEHSAVAPGASQGRSSGVLEAPERKRDANFALEVRSSRPKSTFIFRGEPYNLGLRSLRSVRVSRMNKSVVASGVKQFVKINPLFATK